MACAAAARVPGSAGRIGSQSPASVWLLWSRVAWPPAGSPLAMGSTESSEARRVSFGMDEEERVRVLQGIRVSGPPAGAKSERGLGRVGVEGAGQPEGRFGPEIGRARLAH